MADGSRQHSHSWFWFPRDSRPLADWLLNCCWPRQHSDAWFRFPWDLWSHFTIWWLREACRLSPPTIWLTAWVPAKLLLAQCFLFPSPIGHMNTFYRLTQESELLYDRRFTANQFVLAISPLRLTTRIFIFQMITCFYSSYVTSSLTRGLVCRLQLRLVFASAVMYVCMCKGWAYSALAPRPTVVYCAYVCM
jgi:hypothetical protein